MEELVLWEKNLEQPSNSITPWTSNVKSSDASTLGDITGSRKVKTDIMVCHEENREVSFIEDFKMNK